MKRQKLIIAASFIVLLGLLQAIWAQELMRSNPADRNDPKALLRNPAIIPFQNLAVNFGMRILNYGFLEDNPAGIRYTYNTTSYPDLLGTGIALGFLAQTFTASIYSQSEFGLATAYSLGDVFAVGVTTRFRNHNFNPGKMDLVDPNDPVFANGTGQWNMSFDAGLVVSPSEELSIALSISNLNKPDLSLANSGANLPRELSFGGKYLYRDFGFSLFGNYYNEKIALGIITEASLQNRFIFRLGYLGGDDCFTAETQINMFKGIGLTYRFDYPLNAMNSFGSGTHQLELSWNMRYNPLYAYDVSVSTDTVIIYHEIPVLRISEEAFSDTIWEIVDPKDLLFDMNRRQKIEPRDDDIGLPLDDIEQDTSFIKASAVFRDNFKDVRHYLENTGRRIMVKIVYNDATTAERALLLKKFFIDSLKIPMQDIIIAREEEDTVLDSTVIAKIDSIKDILQQMHENDFVDQNGYRVFYGFPKERMEPEEIVFRITDIRRQKVAKWRIIITDFLGQKIHELSGYHKVEPEVLWDGFTANGTFVRSGNLLYYFQYSMDGRRWVPKRPKRHRITFRYIKRERVIEIRTKEIRDFDLLKNIVVKLKSSKNGKKAVNQ